MSRLSGKVAFVTGAARGQGRAHAVRLAREGADIIAIDVCAPVATVKYAAATPEDLAETVRLVEEQDRRILARQSDVRDLGAMQAVMDEAIAEFGQLDIVVANAAVLSSAKLWELTSEQWQQVIDTNLTGVWHTIKVSVPPMIERNQGGSIILISSVSGLRGLPFCGHYNAAKHGVVGLCRTLANELGEYDIRVNSVHPNGVNTEMQNMPDMFGLIEQYQHTLGPIFMNALPHVMVEPEDISNTVAFLASDEARYMTGAQIPVDLGTMIR